MTDKIEQEIQAKGLNAPRITPADLQANIADPLRCMGTNCTAPIGEHSSECLAETAKIQGWPELP